MQRIFVLLALLVLAFPLTAQAQQRGQGSTQNESDLTWTDLKTGQSIRVILRFSEAKVSGAIVVKKIDGRQETVIEPDSSGAISLEPGQEYATELQLRNDGDAVSAYPVALNAGVSNFRDFLGIQEASYSPAGGQESSFSMQDIFGNSGQFLEKILIALPKGNSILRMSSIRQSQ